MFLKVLQSSIDFLLEMQPSTEGSNSNKDKGKSLQVLVDSDEECSGFKALITPKGAKRESTDPSENQVKIETSSGQTNINPFELQ